MRALHQIQLRRAPLLKLPRLLLVLASGGLLQRSAHVLQPAMEARLQRGPQLLLTRVRRRLCVRQRAPVLALQRRLMFVARVVARRRPLPWAVSALVSRSSSNMAHQTSM